MAESRSPVSVTRRNVVIGLGATALTGFAGAAYAVGIEPARLSIATYRIRPIGPWPSDFRLRIIALADIHACKPWMSLDRISRIVETANGLGADLAVLLGDYARGLPVPFIAREVMSADWAPALARLKTPLGTYAILGNHDWWEDRGARKRGHGPTIAGEAIKRAGIRLLENEALRLDVGGHGIWLAGLGDQLAFLGVAKKLGLKRHGADDLAATLAPIPESEPAILLAHEPDIFPKVPSRITLQLSGHTHGGQIRFFGQRPFVPSRYGERFAYGHVREHTDLVVSGGLGMTAVPMRLGVPPEITVVELVGDAVS